jgi:urease alpha subunit
LHSDELHKFYSSPNIVRQIKPKRMKWAEHITHMGVDRNVYKVLVDVKMVSKWILGRQAGVGVQWMHFSG